MKKISFKMEDKVFGEMEELLSILKKPRDNYINEAIGFYNTVQKREIHEQKLRLDAELLKDNSLAALKDFEDIYNLSDDPDF